MEDSYKPELVNLDQPNKAELTEYGPPLLKSCRFILLVMMFTGFLLHYFVRLNISLAIGELHWDRNMMMNVLAAYFYGYVPVQILGGWTASKFGGKHVYGTGMLVASLLSIISPIAARTSPYFLMTLRIIIGAGHGLCFPAGNALFGRWIPTNERSKLIATALIGSVVGAILAFFLTGLFCSVQLDNGWPLAFYVPGVIGVIWWIVYIMLVYSSPVEHPRIGVSEKMYIMRSIGEKENADSRTITFPWKAIFTSSAVWAIVVAHFAQGFGYYTALIALPLYIKDVIKYNIKQNGGLSALPQISLALATPLIGYLVDVIRRRKILTTAVIRKICQAISMAGCAGFFVGAGFLGCEQSGLAITFIVIAVTFLSFGRCGFQVNNVDIAPRIAGLVYSISNTFANLSGFLIPLIVGAITVTGKREEWQTVFYIFSAVMLTGGVFFGIFARGEVQKWALNLEKSNDEQIVTRSGQCLKRGNYQLNLCNETIEK